MKIDYSNKKLSAKELFIFLVIANVRCDYHSSEPKHLSPNTTKRNTKSVTINDVKFGVRKKGRCRENSLGIVLIKKTKKFKQRLPPIWHTDWLWNEEMKYITGQSF